MSATTFIDTSYVIALINRRDQHHLVALDLAKRFEGARFLITDAVFLEIGNALAKYFRQEATQIVGHFLASPDVEIVHLTPELFIQSLQLFTAHSDKEWSLVDCVSFVVMREAGVSEALTFDQHFAQAGFRPLMRIDSQ